MPAVVVSTGQFNKLAKTVMHAQKVPESVCIEIKENPEFISEAELLEVADMVCDAAVARLTKEHAGRNFSF